MMKFLIRLYFYHGLHSKFTVASRSDFKVSFKHGCEKVLNTKLELIAEEKHTRHISDNIRDSISFRTGVSKRLYDYLELRLCAKEALNEVLIRISWEDEISSPIIFGCLEGYWDSRFLNLTEIWKLWYKLVKMIQY